MLDKRKIEFFRKEDWDLTKRLEVPGQLDGSLCILVKHDSVLLPSVLFCALSVVAASCWLLAFNDHADAHDSSPELNLRIFTLSNMCQLVQCGSVGRFVAPGNLAPQRLNLSFIFELVGSSTLTT